MLVIAPPGTAAPPYVTLLTLQIVGAVSVQERVAAKAGTDVTTTDSDAFASFAPPPAVAVTIATTVYVLGLA